MRRDLQHGNPIRSWQDRLSPGGTDAAITQKTVIGMRLSAGCPTHARTNAHAGKHELVIDDPADLQEIWNLTRA
jgi:hypothetical protein